MFGNKSYHILNVWWGDLVSVIMTAVTLSTKMLHLALSPGRSSTARITPPLWKQHKQQTRRWQICKTRVDLRLLLILLLNIYDLMQCFKKYVCPQRAVAAWKLVCLCHFLKQWYNLLTLTLEGCDTTCKERFKCKVHHFCCIRNQQIA